MRISFSHQFDVYRNDLTRSQEAFFNAQRKVATGKRIQSVSDDPFAAASSVSYRQVKAASAQYAKNAQSGKSELSFAENTLAEMSGLVQRANELAISGANGATNQSGREAMALEIGVIQKRLVELSNAQGPDEAFLFSGQATDTRPFTVTGNTVTYAGDNNPRLVETSPTETLDVSVKLGTFIPGLYTTLETLKNDLQGGNTGAISGVDLANVQSAKRALDQMRGEVGTRIQSADQALSHHTRRMDDLTSRISDLEDVDMAEAILEYKTAETAYQAAMQTVSAGSQLSLMDFLR